ncbi:MAG TPA: PPOX class F420-dependent oxidoreductase [Anaerolineales bacterium]|jgi:PPOX class probable F420-dependent enzyme|nr:PPOX class F420-dependent oxidoreductase [Anaerolineales bacterium]
MEEMTPAQRREFLLEGPRTGKLATVRKDGRPHVVPIWYVLDGDILVFTTWHETVKAANMRRDPHVCICVDDPEPPFAFVMIEGTVAIEEQPDNFEHWTTKIAGRYMGPELAESYGKRNSVEGEWLVWVTPTKVIARRNIAD